MAMTTIYRVDSTKGSWKCMLEELELPSDTDQITIKHVSHITETMRQEQKEQRNADNNGT